MRWLSAGIFPFGMVSLMVGESIYPYNIIVRKIYCIVGRNIIFLVCISLRVLIHCSRFSRGFTYLNSLCSLCNCCYNRFISGSIIKIIVPG